MAKPAKPAPGSNSAIGFLVVVLLLTIVAAGAGLAVGTMVQPPELVGAKADETVPAQPERDKEHGGEPAAQSAAAELPDPSVEHQDLKIVPFPPILTSLAEPQGTWIRIDGSMLLTAEGDENPEVLVEKAGTQILTYLRTVKLSQIEGPSGMLHLRDDLNDTVFALSNGQIREVLIHSLVVE